MVRKRGWWWPDYDVKAYKIIPGIAETSIPIGVDYVTKRKVVLQAGGNVGIYPFHLAKHFETVFTFEPDSELFECLVRNCDGIDNIKAEMTGLSSSNEGGMLAKSIVNAGSARFGYTGKHVPTKTIDSLDLEQCDLIWLSTNGCNHSVILGARETIERCKPVIILHESHAERPDAREELESYQSVDVIPLREHVMMPC